MAIDDPMWAHFAPLWRDLATIGNSRILVAGGYGLYLKQIYLLSSPTVPIIVPLDRWTDATPRGTNDLDFVLGLEIIADQESQNAIVVALTKQDFTEQDPRWQFAKEIPENRKIVVDLHAPSPPKASKDFDADRFRVKSKPSFGSDGIHGRTNPEAIGCDIQPFEMTLQGSSIRTPNPVSWSIMKLTAANDRWLTSVDSNAPERKRNYSRSQAIKHAQDVCRVIAMVTRDESDASGEVIDALRATPEFEKAATISAEVFTNERSWTAPVLANLWREEDLRLIRSTLSSWFQ